MNRFISVLKIDAKVQFRNNLYYVGIAVSVIVAGMFGWLANASQLGAVVPALLLIVVGGTTMLYVGALVFFEKDQGVLNATIVSPVRPSEYLWSKILTLVFLATVESIVLVGGGMAIISFSETVPLPNIFWLILGIIAIGVIYTLFGIGLMVRYKKFIDYLMPMAALVGILQLPFLYFWGVIELRFFLIFPTSAPAMLMRGAFLPLETWEWVYGIVYTLALIVGLAVWASRAFEKHIVNMAG